MDAVHPPAEMLELLDACIDLFATDEAIAVKKEALLGLTDLRRSLFPRTADYFFGVSSDESGFAT